MFSPRPWRVGVLIFAVAFPLFLASPVRPLADSRYSLVLSQSLLERGSFALDDYFIRPPTRWPTHFEVINGRLYYYYPPGSSVLSVPFVGVMKALGVSAVRDNGSYDLRAETLIQATLAAALMAGFASLIFHTARLLLPVGWSLLIAAGGTLGSQVWSTASRVLWSHTWGIFLLGWVVWTLVRLESHKSQGSPIWLATLLAWTYFIRPTNSIAVLSTTAYLLLYHRSLLLRYAGTGAAWLLVFVAYSRLTFGRNLPTSYHRRRAEWAFRHFWSGLTGALFSPSRGLFIFVPSLLFVGYLVVRYWRYVPHKRLVGVSLATSATHIAMVAVWQMWWGGHSYGPRLLSELVPWCVLLAILGVRALLNGRVVGPTSTSPSRRWERGVGAALLLASVLINARGAISKDTVDWNSLPINVDERPSRVWDWQKPQFLGGVWSPPCPTVLLSGSPRPRH